MDEKLYILAGNKQEADNWAFENHRSRSDYYYVENETHIRGMRNIEYIIIGTFWDRPDAQQLHDMLRVIGATNYRRRDTPAV